mgnify:CR=1 FL=1
MNENTDYVEVEVSIVAIPDVVWAFVSDINVPAQFSREFKGAEWLDAPGLGATFRGDNAVGDYKWSTVSVVTDFKEIKELDMNPVLVFDKGKGCKVVDIRIGLA